MARYGSVNRGQTRAISTFSGLIALATFVSLTVAYPAAAQDLEPLPCAWPETVDERKPAAAGTFRS